MFFWKDNFRRNNSWFDRFVFFCMEMIQIVPRLLMVLRAFTISMYQLTNGVPGEEFERFAHDTRLILSAAVLL